MRRTPFLSRLLLGCTILFLSACGQADNTDRPDVLSALADNDIQVYDEFKTDTKLRAFAASIGDQPIGVYVLPNGQAIVGTRINTEGTQIDTTTLEKLVLKPMSQKTWQSLADAHWVAEGDPDAPRIVYEFSDPNCPYCHKFWQVSQPWIDADKVQVRHILVGIIRADSPAKAAAIFTADNPTAAFNKNEKRFNQGGIKPADSISDDIKQKLMENYKLFVKLGFRGTPGIVYLDEDGIVHKTPGLPHAQQLIDMMGPKPE